VSTSRATRIQTEGPWRRSSEPESTNLNVAVTRP
jgi:hypothetical protein